MSTVISLEAARRKRAAPPSGVMLTAMGSSDPQALSRQLCQHLATANACRPVLLASIVGQGIMSEEELIVAAAYASVLGWIVYDNKLSVVLTDAGSAVASPS
jgi:hypothetical protein